MANIRMSASILSIFRELGSPFLEAQEVSSANS